jgi:hypothetical protein
MKDKKQLLEEIMDDVMKNQYSRELELEHVQEYLMPKAKKIKNKDEKKVHVESLKDKEKQLKEEMEARENIIKILEKKLK